MNGMDMAYHAWSKEMHEAHLARHKEVKGELSLSPEPVSPALPRPLERANSSWTSRIAAMVPTLRRMVLGAA